MREQGGAAEGLALIDLVLELTTRCYGDDHPRTAAVLANRAVALRAAGKRREAKQNRRMAQIILNTHPGIQGLRQRVDVGDFAQGAHDVMPPSEPCVNSGVVKTPRPRPASTAKHGGRLPWITK